MESDTIAFSLLTPSIAWNIRIGGRESNELDADFSSALDCEINSNWTRAPKNIAINLRTNEKSTFNLAGFHFQHLSFDC